MSYVIPDIQPFVSNDGAVIEGRRQWREHLKANDLVELGHSDIKDAESAQEKRRREALEKVQRLQKEVIASGKKSSPCRITSLRKNGSGAKLRSG